MKSYPNTEDITDKIVEKLELVMEYTDHFLWNIHGLGENPPELGKEEFDISLDKFNEACRKYYLINKDKK